MSLFRKKSIDKIAELAECKNDDVISIIDEARKGMSINRVAPRESRSNTADLAFFVFSERYPPK